MHFYHETIVELEHRYENLSLIKNDDGEEFIREKFDGMLIRNIEVDYETTDVSCTCSRNKKRDFILT